MGLFNVLVVVIRTYRFSPLQWSIKSVAEAIVLGDVASPLPRSEEHTMGGPAVQCSAVSSPKTI